MNNTTTADTKPHEDETTGSNAANRKLVEAHLEVKASLSTAERELLFDPQTSGGLLLSVPAGQAQQLVQALRTAGVMHAKLVGMAFETPHPVVRVLLSDLGDFGGT